MSHPNVIIALQHVHSSWTCHTHGQLTVWSAGSAFLENSFLEGHALSSRLAEQLGTRPVTSDSIIGTLDRLNGHYGLIVQTHEFTWAVVDRVRSVPLFFRSHSNSVHISDSAQHLVDNPRPDAEGCQSYLLAGYVTGNRTLLADVQQILGGQMVCIENSRSSLKLCSHYQYVLEDESLEHSASVGQFQEHLATVLESAFQRLLRRVENRRILVPLSGGWDSRLVVAMLARLGFDNVLCFSYGVPNNVEAVASKRVASALRLSWDFIPYTARSLAENIFSSQMEAYWDFAGNYSGTPVFTNWLAIKTLTESGKLREDDVFVPGHTGDFLAGGHITPAMFTSCRRETAEDVIINKHLSLWPNEVVKTQLRQQIQEQLRKFKFDTASDVVSACEYWDWRERQCKFIVNSGRVYEFWGKKWWLPLWDMELVDFYCQVPLSLRLFRKLYFTTLVKHIFEGELSDIPLAEGSAPREVANRVAKLRRVPRRHSMRSIMMAIVRRLRKFAPGLIGQHVSPSSQSQVVLADSYFTSANDPGETSVSEVFNAHYCKAQLSRECAAIMEGQWAKPVRSVSHFGMLSLLNLKRCSCKFSW